MADQISLFCGSHTAPETISGYAGEVRFVDYARGVTHVVMSINGRDVMVIGSGDPVLPGDQITATGVWEYDPRTESRFNASSLISEFPDTADGIRRFLTSPRGAGLDARGADRILRKFGARLALAMNSPTALIGAGLPEEKAVELSQIWTFRQKHARLLSLLLCIGIGRRGACRVIQKFGDDAVMVVTRNPYALIGEVRGFSFQRADGLALSQGLARNDANRVRAGIRHVIRENGKSGHSAASEYSLLKSTSDMLGVHRDEIEAQVEAMLAEGTLIRRVLQGRNAIFERGAFDAEIEIAREMLNRAGCIASDVDLGGVVSAAEQQVEVALDPAQRAAVLNCLAHQTSIITGGPGTGKTATVRVVIAALKLMQPETVITLAAPTGRAAQRMAEACEMEANTLHRTLEYSSHGRDHKGGWIGAGFRRNAENPLETDALIIDEVSMLDLYLTRDTLRALPKGARLILVGDVDQLPSVGAGAILADLIGSSAVPTSRLTKIFRQGAGSGISAAAVTVNSGRMPRRAPPDFQTDFWMVFEEDPSEIRRRTVKAVQALAEMGFNPLRDIQVLAPGHDYDAGTIALNRAIQTAVSPAHSSDPFIEVGHYKLRAGDRVIQVSNDYDLDVFNGDIGNVLEIHESEDRPGHFDALTVDFDGREVVYQGSAVRNLQLAYCISIHKSQGSEFPAVVATFSMQHFGMLQRNLLYTALTRAKKLCCLIGQQRAIETAVMQPSAKRTTGVKEAISALKLAG